VFIAVRRRRNLVYAKDTFSIHTRKQCMLQHTQHIGLRRLWFKVTVAVTVTGRHQSYKPHPQACTTPPQPLLNHPSNNSVDYFRETNYNVTIPVLQLAYAPRIASERSTSKKRSPKIDETFCQHQQFVTQLLSVRWASTVVLL